MAHEAQLEELDRRRRLCDVEMLASRALLAADVSALDAPMTAAFEAVSSALDVRVVALLGIEADSVSIEVIWSSSWETARLTAWRMPRTVLPDLSELVDEQETIRVGADRLPDDIAAIVVDLCGADAEVIAVPLIAGATVLGALVVVPASVRVWGTDEIRFMESIARSAWSCLARHHTETALAQRAAEAELLAGFGRMIVDTGPRLDSALVRTILEQLARHVGAEAVIAFERRGDVARPFAEWNPDSVGDTAPTDVARSDWDRMLAASPLPWVLEDRAIYPAVQEGEVIGFLAVVAGHNAPLTHQNVITETVELLRQLRVRVLTERYLDRRRLLEDLRSTIATAYVEADHWQVVETTVQGLASIGEIVDADCVAWLNCDGGVDPPIDRLWTRTEGSRSEARSVLAAALADPDRLENAGSPFTIEPPGGGSNLGDACNLVVIPARIGNRTKGALVLMIPVANRVAAIDLAVLGEIAQLVEQMEEWAEVEAKTDIRRERLQYQATHDELTGLGNRRLLVETLEIALERGRAAVLMIDMDRFKVVNDSLGHTAGDAVLTAIADRLRMSVREPDLTCRFGGDEFAVLVPDARDEAELAALALRLIEMVSQPVEVRGTTVIPTCSIGIAITAEGDDLESVLRHADAALYRAKDLGRDRYEFFDENNRETLRDRLALETSLRQGLRDYQFEPWFQPEVELESRGVVGVEALIRWNHPSNGILPASSFIDVADEVGLAPEMSRIALEGSCAALAEWRRSGFDTRVRVNVAAAQLQTGDLGAFVARVLAEHEIPSDRLCVEITERSLMLDIDSAGTALRQLKRMGVEVAIDDFGTGFSSLARLRGLPVDTLKIDRSFVAGLDTSRTDRDIVATIIGLADAVGLDVVAEGVENEAQATILTDLGCRRAQGWLWSGALPREEIPTLLTRV